MMDYSASKNRSDLSQIRRQLTTVVSQRRGEGCKKSAVERHYDRYRRTKPPPTDQVDLD